MTDIKTVLLDGSELKVEGLGGQNTMIINLGAATIYASANPNIVPDGDNVIQIAAGDRDGLYNTNGTVYLLGTGKVNLRGTDYTTNFSRPSRSADGGGTSGDGVSQAYVDSQDIIMLNSAKAYTDSEIEKTKTNPLTKAELNELLFNVYGPEPTMPHMDGIVGYFTPSSMGTDLWNNVLGENGITLENVVLNADEVVFDSNSSGSFAYPEPPLVFYMIGKLDTGSISNSRKKVLYRGITTYPNYQDNALALETANNKWVVENTLATQFGDNREYGAIAIAQDLDVAGTLLKAYSTDSNDVVSRNQNKSLTLNGIKSRYSGTVTINDGALAMSIKFLAFGTIAHTDDQIKANCEWLKKKYLGG